MWTVIGQDKAVTFLQKSLEKDSLAHAYLLVGLPHVGKMTLAVNLAMAINCEFPERPCGHCAACLRIASGKHADVQVIELSQIMDSEGDSKTKISVEQVDQILHSVNLAPYEGKYKVFIIDGVEFMSIGAANRLLKTIEEPVQNVIFILLASNESLVPATICSLYGVIEPRGADGGNIAQSALHLVGDREGRHQVPAACARILRRRQNGRQIIAGMAGFAFRQIAVIEVQVADRSSIVKCRMFRTCPSSGQQCAFSVGIECGDVLTNDLRGHGI